MSTQLSDEREPQTPHSDALGIAIQVWAVMEENVRAANGSGPDVAVGEAAAVFHLTPRPGALAAVHAVHRGISCWGATGCSKKLLMMRNSAGLALKLKDRMPVVQLFP